MEEKEIEKFIDLLDAVEEDYESMIDEEYVKVLEEDSKDEA